MYVYEQENKWEKEDTFLYLKIWDLFWKKKQKIYEHHHSDTLSQRHKKFFFSREGSFLCLVYMNNILADS